MDRIVVTGMGAVCSHGMNQDEIWHALMRGENKIAPISARTHFDSEKYPQTKGKVVAAVSHTDDELRALIDATDRGLKRMDRHQLFALMAANEAILSSGLELRGVDTTRVGTSVGTGDGGLTTGFESDARLIEGKKLLPTANLGQLPNIFAGYIANYHGLKGPNFVHCTACAASAHAIEVGADQILLGRADVMLVGGAEAAITPFGIASFAAQGALGSDSRPYQQDRDGFIMGEGAAMLVLEREPHAVKRGARILATLVGYASTSDGNREGTITAPDMNGGYRSAKLALDMAGVHPEAIGYINAHGTGTMADSIELAGIKQWSDGFAGDMTVSSTKSSHGHLLGAAGALEALLSIRMLEHRMVLPTRGLTEQNLDPACEGFDHVMHAPRPKELQCALSNSFGFGGTNATLIFSRP